MWLTLQLWQCFRGWEDWPYTLKYFLFNFLRYIFFACGYNWYLNALVNIFLLVCFSERLFLIGQIYNRDCQSIHRFSLQNTVANYQLVRWKMEEWRYKINNYDNTYLKLRQAKLWFLINYNFKNKRYFFFITLQKKETKKRQSKKEKEKEN